MLFSNCDDLDKTNWNNKQVISYLAAELSIPDSIA